jgi:predicted dehydrogenase
MLKIGVLGSGHTVAIHLDHWGQIDRTEIAGFYEPDNHLAQEIMERYPVHRFLNADQLIDSSDLIDISAPVVGHFEWCEKAIRKGKHVFVEKTLTYSLDEAKQLVKLIKESNVKFQIGFIERFNPAFALLQDLNPSPAYVEAYNMRSMNRIEPAEPLLDLLNSDIDIILSIVKSDVKNIIAKSVGVLTNDSDLINARIEFNNGCVASITSGLVCAVPVHQMRFYERGKFIDIDFISQTVRTLNQEGSEMLEQFLVSKAEGNTLKIQLQEFSNTILNNTPPVISATDGFKAMDITNQILQRIKYSH